MNTSVNKGYSVRSKTYRQGSFSFSEKTKKGFPGKIKLRPIEAKFSLHQVETQKLDYDLKFPSSHLLESFHLKARYNYFDNQNLAKVLGIDQMVNENDDSCESPLTKFEALCPVKFKTRFSNTPSPVKECHLPEIKTEGLISLKTGNQHKNISYGSDSEFSYMGRKHDDVSLEDLRVILKKLKNSK